MSIFIKWKETFVKTHTFVTKMKKYRVTNFSFSKKCENYLANIYYAIHDCTPSDNMRGGSKRTNKKHKKCTRKLKKRKSRKTRKTRKLTRRRHTTRKK